MRSACDETSICNALDLKSIPSTPSSIIELHTLSKLDSRDLVKYRIKVLSTALFYDHALKHPLGKWGALNCKSPPLFIYRWSKLRPCNEFWMSMELSKLTMISFKKLSELKLEGDS